MKPKMNAKTPCPLFTDLYELTMAAVYHERKINDRATFSLFARDQPQRNFFVAAGLDDVLAALQNWRFGADDIGYLKSLGIFAGDFLDHLRRFRFSGTVLAQPEGTIFFPQEPILEVSAPLIEAQIVETFLLNTIGYQTMIATKAARCIYAARGRGVVDFSLRRTQGQGAVVTVPRSTYLAGFDATSSVEAGKQLGIPVSGTMAHSYIGAFEDEIAAFEAFAQLFAGRSVFLIDTYDTLQGAKNAAAVAKRMQKRGQQLLGVRLDSGDMVELSRGVRQILDKAGLPAVKIIASGGFDEHKIAATVAAGAPIDAYGVGTKIGVSADAPYIDVAYKMVRCGSKNTRKISSGKVSLAGEKQVFRRQDETGFYHQDIIGCRKEVRQNSRPLLEPVMIDGRSTRPAPGLENIRRTFVDNFAQLPERYKSLTEKAIYPVRISRRLVALQESAR